MAIATINFPEPLERFYFFKDDQVLTAGQLNQLAGHFDAENRLTRTKGLGIGIVSGLEISQSNGNILVSKGSAITSAGDVLYFADNQEFTHFQKLQDESTQPTEDGTVRVLKLGNETPPVPMWRLHTTAVAGSTPLSNPVGLPGLENLVVVLYLDSWLKSPDECTDTNCDNGGVTQMNDLMVLLVPKQHVLPAENSPNLRRNLTKATVRNVDLAGGTLTNVQELINRYEAAVTGSLDSLLKAIEQVGRFGGLVKLAFGDASPLAQWPVQLRSLASQFNNTPNIQYVYDFFQDLAASLNELWEAITDIPGECCPVADKFSKYIMAGELVLGTGVRFAEYRHYFNESPILNDGASRAAKAVFLLRRIGLMMRSFNLDQQLPSGIAAIRITPSKKAGNKLGDRAIPFYYKLDDVTPLHEFWSFEKSKLGMEDTNQGYWMRGKSDLDDVKNPFSYTTDESDFYRVEGLLGMDIKQAEDEVERLQLLHNLGFKIETIQIEDDLPKVKPFKPIKFTDLNLLFRHNREMLFSNLQLADHYVGSLKTEFDQTPDKEVFKTAKDPDGSDVFTNLTQAVTTNRQEFQGKVSSITDRMYKPLEEFSSKFTEFRKDYDEAATFAETIDRKVSYAKQSSIDSPIQKLVLENSFQRFDLIADIFNKRKDFVLRQYIFEKFFNQNPGLRHQCGVPEGGTLVLAYSAVNQQVVADFALSYCCVVEVDDDDDNSKPPSIEVKPLPGIIFHPLRPTPTQPNEPFIKFKWLDKLDLVSVPRVPDIGVLKDVVKFNDLGGVIKTQVTDFVKTQDFTNAIGNSFVMKGELSNYATTTFVENTAFNKATSVFLDNIGKFGYSGGKTVGTGDVAGDFNFKDTTTKRQADILENSTKRLEILESTPPTDRTPQVEEEINSLRNQVAEQSKVLVEKAGNMQGEVVEGSDSFGIIQLVSDVAQRTKGKVDFSPVTAIVEQQVKASVEENNFSRANAFNALNNKVKL